MKREIKFRGWDPKNNLMAYNLQDMYDMMYHPDFGLSEEDFWRSDFSRAYFGQYQGSEIILMQYTGLKDKNGREIYEGDIINLSWSHPSPEGTQTYDNGNWEVIWRDDRWNLRRGERIYDEGDPEDGEIYWEDVAVIGNIYQYPHLLEGK